MILYKTTNNMHFYFFFNLSTFHSGKKKVTPLYIKKIYNLYAKCGYTRIPTCLYTCTHTYILSRSKVSELSPPPTLPYPTRTILRDGSHRVGRHCMNLLPQCYFVYCTLDCLTDRIVLGWQGEAYFVTILMIYEVNS